MRSRSCTNPPAGHGGKICSGLKEEIQNCSDDVPCPVNGGWTSWGDWDQCSTPCGGGTQKRSRSCTNPPVAHGGKTCAGPKEMTRICNDDVWCPVNGGWTSWSDWRKCSVTCGGGTQTRSRSCNNPPVAHGGKNCSGPNEMTQNCNDDILCPVDGGWSGWGNWGRCDKSCFKTRIRKCNRPSPSNNGKQCPGPPTERLRCSFDECLGGNGGGGKGLRLNPDFRDEGSGDGSLVRIAEWTIWSEWSACSSTCGRSLKFRYRTCTTRQPTNCQGVSLETKSCQVPMCDGIVPT